MKRSPRHPEPRRRRRIWAAVAALIAWPLIAQEAPKPSPTQDLVKAAQQSKPKRKKPTTKVITNKDVKQAKGKLIELPPSKRPVAKTSTVPTIAEQDALYKQRKEADLRVDTAQKNVDKLQKDLETVEQQYYAENDPNYRDNVIQQRFEQTKRQLQDAKQELADARDAAKKLTPQK